MTARRPFLALALAGVLWGTTAPLTKIALVAVEPGWLTVIRFALAALPLLWIARRDLRAAAALPVALSGAAGYGLVVALWNAGLARTSVSHGALLVAGVPALVALAALVLGRGTAGPSAWVGYTVALAGVALVAAQHGGEASVTGDLLVLASMSVSAGFTVAQPGVLAHRNPLAVTAVQFAAAAAVVLPVAVLTEGAPGPVGPTAGWGAVLALVVAGTLLPFTLFAWAQARTTPEVAGAFLNLEPIVGAGAGALAFGDPFGAAQAVGAGAVLGGIALSALPAGTLRDAAERLRWWLPGRSDPDAVLASRG